MIPAFIMWSLLAVLFLVIGFFARRSEKPVGFFANVRAPEVNDVRSYNRAVSNIWLVGTPIFELLGLPFLFGSQNSPVFLITGLGVVFWSIGMMIAYTLISSKYIVRR